MEKSECRSIKNEVMNEQAEWCNSIKKEIILEEDISESFDEEQLFLDAKSLNVRNIKYDVQIKEESTVNSSECEQNSNKKISVAKDLFIDLNFKRLCNHKGIRKSPIENLYKCKSCNRLFTYDPTKKNLVAEKNKHIFMCGVCRKYFTHKSSLTNHLNIHLGYKCSFCRETLTMESVLIRHIAVKHRVLCLTKSYNNTAAVSKIEK